jgi:branched-chain amino acid aminotransferase
MNFTERIWINGEPADSGAACVSALDRGLLYGDGVFETMRLYGGRLFRLDAHLGRLHRGLRFLQITDVPPLHVFERMVTDAAEAVNGADAALRLTVTRGVGGLPSDLRSATSATVIIRVKPFEPEPPERYARGVGVVFAASRRNDQSPLSQHKTLNYLENLLARAEARTQGAYEAVFLNTLGDVAEASAANIFVLSNGVLSTPPPSAGVLAGVTRGCVLEAASALGLIAREERLGVERLHSAQEVFLSNSLIELMPVTVIAGRPVGSGVPGQVTMRLAEAYRELVEEG